METKELPLPINTKIPSVTVDKRQRQESAASNSTFLNSNKNSSDMSPVPKSPISREESSQKDDSKNLTGFGGTFGGINL